MVPVNCSSLRSLFRVLLQAKAAFQRYTDKLREIDDLIVRRNQDPNLKHRCGPAQLPFELLRPFSTPGVTGRGIPNSITV